MIIACFYLFKFAYRQYNLDTFYKRSIFKVWIFGFVADIIGFSIMFLLGIEGNSFGLPYKVTNGICDNPFSNLLSLIIVVFAMLVSAVLIFIFNYNFTFKNQIEYNKLRLKVALTIAFVTMPWTFLLPTMWFY